MAKYKRKAFIRPEYIELSLSAANRKGNKKYQFRISNLDERDLKEVNFDKHVWKTLFDTDVLKLKVTRNSNGDEIAVLIWKPTGEYIAFNTDNRENLIRLHKALRKAYYKWKISDWSNTAHHETRNVNVNSNNRKEIYWDKKNQTWKVKR